jgi:hypothetical protein
MFFISKMRYEPLQHGGVVDAVERWDFAEFASKLTLY